MEQNHCEYSDLKSNLKQMMIVVRDLTDKHSHLAEKIKRRKRRGPYNYKKTTRVDLSKFIKQGDILSNLMDFEKRNIFSTEEVYDFISMRKAAVDFMNDNVLESRRVESSSMQDGELNESVSFENLDVDFENLNDPSCILKSFKDV